MSTTPANWYPDPQQPSRKRYWDGARWTGYLVDPDKPTVVRYERPPWEPSTPGKPFTPGGINVPLSVAVTSAF
ncbi:DUF2510 domain-containing protein [Cellulomonas sp. URHE0023]|uniref:DUF2510 domain-containing protein n=1 Tax=Cellulomonas sp. URHE0023 TaxID=1380354 RepID=UPI000484D4B8|nr:DUF2510 domain-containing protein [Cellulomonas sp. URHE0023]